MDDRELKFHMEIVNEMAIDGTPMAAVDRLIRICHDYHQAKGRPTTVNKAVSEVLKASCHSSNGVKCMMCDTCKSWMVSARYICLLCLSDESPKISRLLQGCTKNCGANNALFDQMSLRVSRDGELVSVCSHVKKTGVGKCYELFNATQHIGNIVKMNQLGLLVNSTRREILDSIQYCTDKGMISYVTSLNYLASFRVMGEDAIVKAIESYWSGVTSTEDKRGFLDYTVDALDSPRFEQLSPKPSMTLFSA